MKRLVSILFSLCPHDRLTWPTRDTDGIDRQTCLECGKRMDSVIQFKGGNSK